MEPNPEVAQAGTRTITGALSFSSEGATTADGEVLLQTEGHNATGEGDSGTAFSGLHRQPGTAASTPKPNPSTTWLPPVWAAPTWL